MAKKKAESSNVKRLRKVLDLMGRVERDLNAIRARWCCMSDREKAKATKAVEDLGRVLASKSIIKLLKP